MTSGLHSVGALEGEEWSRQHHMDCNWIDRALLQGVEDPLATLHFPEGLHEHEKRRAVANMVPPPFAAVLHQAVDQVLQSAYALGRELQARRPIASAVHDTVEDSAEGPMPMTEVAPTEPRDRGY